MDFPVDDPLGMPPEILPGLDWVYEAWGRLGPDRQGGMSVRGTPYAAREAFFDRHGFDSATREEMHYYFDQLDRALLKHVAASMKATK